MHDLINRMLHVFVEDTYGRDRWDAVLREARLSRLDIEGQVGHDRLLTERLTGAVETLLARPITAVFEDVGTYLVSHPNAQSIRRLLRFCGNDFVDFLLSLEELPGRVRLAIPDLDLPEIEVREAGGGAYEIRCHDAMPGFADLLAGIVRAMADDFGVLVVIDHGDRRVGGNAVRVSVIEAQFAAGRDFVLGAGAGGDTGRP